MLFNPTICWGVGKVNWASGSMPSWPKSWRPQPHTAPLAQAVRWCEGPIGRLHPLRENRMASSPSPQRRAVMATERRVRGVLIWRKNWVRLERTAVKIPKLVGSLLPGGNYFPSGSQGFGACCWHRPRPARRQRFFRLCRNLRRAPAECPALPAPARQPGGETVARPPTVAGSLCRTHRGSGTLSCYRTLFINTGPVRVAGLLPGGSVLLFPKFSAKPPVCANLFFF